MKMVQADTEQPTSGLRSPKQMKIDEARKSMTEFCVREYQRLGKSSAYISALISAAHLCDQIAREGRSGAHKAAAKECADFLWLVATEVLRPLKTDCRARFSTTDRE